MNKFENYCTKFVQSIGDKEGAVSPSIVSSASFSYGSPETAEGIFNGSVKKPLYSRMGNPTTAKLESILAEMDGGVGAGKMALIPDTKKRALRDFGMSANTHASYQTMLGLATLARRLPRIVKNIEIIIKELAKNSLHVNHPSLESHPHYRRYKEDFQFGCGTLFTIDMKTKEKAYDFLRKTKLATITANIGDTRTLALHMASTIYSDFDESTRKFLGITDGLIRISIGLENPQEIINDFLKAAK